MLFVGIDWADQKHDVVVINEKQEKLLRVTVTHDHKGLEKLRGSLDKISPQREDFACIVETRNGLLVQYLLEVGLPVYPVNPKVVQSRRKASGAKTDSIDALLLADYGRTELSSLQRLTPRSELLQELQMLTRDQEVLINDQTRITNRLTACLKEYYPVALSLFSSLTGKTSLDFLREYPTLGHARNIDKATLVKLLKQNRIGHATKKAEELLDAVHKTQLEAAPSVVRAKSRFMLSLLKQLESIQADIGAYDKEIQKLFNSHSDSAIFSSLPGVGPRIGPRLLAEWGDDRQRYISAEAVQALAGTSPVMFQSGKYRKAKKRRACVKPFRNALQQMAFTCLRNCSWARELYDSKRTSGNCHNAALRAVANRWVKIIFSMWMQGTTYNEERFLAVRAKHSTAA